MTLSLGVSLGCAAFFPSGIARADEFAVLPLGDPIYAQLATLGHAGAAQKSPVALTRYEAALQTARVILDLQNADGAHATRADWRALAALTNALKSELRQLGVDVEATRALAAKNLQKTTTKPGVSVPPTPDNGELSALGTKMARSGAAQKKAAPSSSLLLGPKPGLPTAGVLAWKSSQGAMEVQLSPRLHAETALQAVQRTGLDPFNNSLSAASSSSGRSVGDTRVESLGSQTAFSYDLSRFLTLRAANSKLNWNGTGQAPLLSPLLGAPLFEGANRAAGTGGGIDVNLGAGLKLSTEIERLRANTGAAANRIGGGASLSAFQNRLSMNMSLSRLVPEDKTALPSTAAQLGASLDVTQRLSLSLLYQGLFAPTPSSSASRVSGGLSLSF